MTLVTLKEVLTPCLTDGTAVAGLVVLVVGFGGREVLEPPRRRGVR